jgi:hypothetical protein
MTGTTNAVGLDAGMWNDVIDLLIEVARINNVVVAYKI